MALLSLSRMSINDSALDADTSSSFSSAITEKPPLLNLSAELRNQIWELAFTPNVPVGDSVDIFSASGSACDLLLTCQQVHAEARGLFQDARRQYWEESTFSVDMTWKTGEVHDQAARLRRLRCPGVELIKNIWLRLSLDSVIIHARPVADTRNMAWRISIYGNELEDDGDFEDHDVCIVGRSIPHVAMQDAEDTSGPTLDEINGLIYQQKAHPNRRIMQGRKFSQVWEAMLQQSMAYRNDEMSVYLRSQGVIVGRH